MQIVKLLEMIENTINVGLQQANESWGDADEYGRESGQYEELNRSRESLRVAAGKIKAAMAALANVQDEYMSDVSIAPDCAEEAAEILGGVYSYTQQFVEDIEEHWDCDSDEAEARLYEAVKRMQGHAVGAQNIALTIIGGLI